MVLMLLFLGGRSGMRSGIVDGLLCLPGDGLAVLLQDLPRQLTYLVQVGPGVGVMFETCSYIPLEHVPLPLQKHLGCEVYCEMSARPSRVSSWKRRDLRLVTAQDSVFVFFGGHCFQCGVV
jgi:hypothetical protein